MAAERAGALERPQVGDLLDDADDGTVAPWVGTDGAGLGGVDVAAGRAQLDRRGGLGEGPRQGSSSVSRRLIKWSAARRAERGPSPGSLARS